MSYLSSSIELNNSAKNIQYYYAELFKEIAYEQKTMNDMINYMGLFLLILVITTRDFVTFIYFAFIMFCIMCRNKIHQQHINNLCNITIDDQLFNYLFNIVNIEYVDSIELSPSNMGFMCRDHSTDIKICKKILSNSYPIV